MFELPNNEIGWLLFGTMVWILLFVFYHLLIVVLYLMIGGSTPMRDHLLAFIKEVQKRSGGDVDGKQFRSTVQIGEKGVGTLLFGYGYFNMGGCLWFDKDGHPSEVSNEDGVDALLKAYGLD